LRKELGWENKIILIMTRSFKSIYDHKTFLKAFEFCIKKNRELRLILIGEGYLKKEILGQLDNIGKNYYKYYGFCSPIEISNYLNASDIYVNSSLSDGASCSMLEAMACGLPVITTNIFVNYEWVKYGENGFIFSKRSSEEMSEYILKLAEDVDLRNKMHKNNVKLSKEFANWDRNFDMLNKLLTDLKFKFKEYRN
jgi:glycosyltransferase involved in cell wall biosynthesis